MKHALSVSLLLAVTFSLFYIEGRAQNLFKNPGFESYNQCPTYTSQINRCTDWDSAIGAAIFIIVDTMLLPHLEITALQEREMV